MTPERYHLGMTPPAMSATKLGLFLRRIRATRSVPALHSLADEIEREFPSDEATPRLLAVIAVRVTRPAGRASPTRRRCRSSG